MNDTITQRISRILLILLFMLAGFESFAQYTKTSLETGRYYTAITKDQSGNVYVVRSSGVGTDKYEVAKYTGGTGTPQIIYNNLVDLGNDTYPWGIAVNSLGDVFVTNVDQGAGWEIIKLAAPAYTKTTIHTGNYYSALAVDNSNNLLAMEYDGGTNAYQLVRYPFGAEQLGGTVVYNGFTFPASGFPATYPTNIAVDSHDNIYLTDFHENSGGRIVKLTAPGFTSTQLATNRSFSSLAVDASDVFYTSEASAGGQFQVVKYTDLTQTGTVLYAGLHNSSLFYPWGITVTNGGTVYANDGNGGGEVVKLSPPTINVTSIVRGNPNPTATPTVTFTVTFSGNAANVDASDFTLTSTGLTGAAITGVTGSNNVYTVTANTGTGSTGTLRLDLVTGNNIAPTVVNAPFTAGQVYTIDRIAPTGALTINSGALYTNNPNVTLGISASDANTPIVMSVSNTAVFGADEALAATKAWALTAGDGLKTVNIRYKDAAGNAALYSQTITLDQTAPTATLVSPPPSLSNSPNATFNFTSNEPGTFQGSLGAGALVAITSPQSYTGLADGPHSFNLVAVDRAGNTSTMVTYNWTVDATAPTVTSVDVPANGYYNATQTLNFIVHYSENVTVTGTPSLDLTIGGVNRQATLISGNGTDALFFQYQVVSGDNDADGITIGANLLTNGGTVADAAGNTANLALQNVANTNGVRVNTTIPTVTLSTTAPALVNAPFTVTATFSEPVTGLTIGDFVSIGATASNLQTSDNITYTLTVTPAVDGTKSINLPANSAVNTGNNANTASNTLNYVYDGTAPVVTAVSVPADAYYKAGQNLNFSVTFSEPVNVTGTPNLTLTIGAAPANAVYISGSGTTTLNFRYTVQNGDMDMDGIAVNALVANGGTLRDAATNNANLTLNGLPATTGVRVNTSHPSVTISSTAPINVNGAFVATVTFSEAVTGLVAAGITGTNATISNLQTTDNITYTVTVTPTAEGTITVVVPADAAQNIGDNGNTASNTLSRTYDITAPTVTAVAVPSNGYYNAGTTLNFTAHFSEDVVITGTPAITLTIGSTPVQATYTGTSGTNALNFSYTVVDGNMDMDGITVGTLVLNGGTIKDIPGNDAVLTLNGVGNTAGVFVNTQHPTATLSSTAPATVIAPFTVQITFSEGVTGLTASDFTVTNAAVNALVQNSSNSYTVTITPGSDGPISVSLMADVVVNIGDNGNTASNIITRTADLTAPVVTAVAVPINGYYKEGETLDFIVKFGENIVLNTTGGSPSLDIVIGSAVVNATLINSSTNTISFSYTVQNGDMDMDGISVSTLQLNGATLKDAAGNDADLTLNNIGTTTGVRVNTVHPTVTITSAAPAIVNAPYTVTVTFSESVTGLTAGAFVTNATISNLQTTDNITYTATVTPAAEGTVSVSLPADIALNIGGNGNTASATLTRIYDITGPTVTHVDVPASRYYTTGEVLSFTVHYDEDIIIGAGGVPSISLAIGSAIVNAPLTGTVGTNAMIFSYTVQIGDMDMDGIVVGTLSLNGSSITDAATNNANPILFNVPNTSGVRVNTTSASVTLTSAAPAVVNTPFTITATFSEAVTGLTATDFTITNGVASNLTTADNITYTLLVTPAADGTVSIQLPANAAVNIGNNGTIASNTLTFTYDATAPVVTTVSVPNNGYYKQGDVMNFTVFFSENINLNVTGGSPYLNVILGTATVQAAFTSASSNGLGFSYTVQPGDMDLDGIAIGTLNANGAIITDAATNNANLTLNNVANTSGVFVHTASPSVQLSTAAAARVNAPFTVTIVFNEAVTGLAAGDFTVTNGTAGTLQTTDNTTYTLLVTPTADGTVTIQLPAGQAANVVSNNNTASNTLSLTYDATAPAIDGGQSFEILERSTVGTQVGQVTATDASGILTSWAIASDDSNGAFAIDVNGNIVVADQAKLNSKANSTVTLTITVSDGLNTSTAVPVTVMVKFVNQSPTLDAIADATICPDAQEHTIQLTGASAVEPGQTYGFNIITDKPNFDKLSVSATGLITYQLKASATGTAAVTVTIKDNGGTANGGTDTLRRTFNITVATLGQVTITSDKGNTISKGDIVHLTATGGTIFKWDDANGIISGQQDAVLEARPMENTTYHVTVSNDAGCSNTADFTVTVVPDFKVDAINILTPNGDGKNDKWVIRNLDSYPDNEVTIYDRTGRIVFTRRNYSNDWDGTMNGSPLGEGTYYYVLKIEGGAKTAKGYITIIRDRN